MASIQVGGARRNQGEGVDPMREGDYRRDNRYKRDRGPGKKMTAREGEPEANKGGKGRSNGRWGRKGSITHQVAKRDEGPQSPQKLKKGADRGACKTRSIELIRPGGRRTNQGAEEECERFS